MKVLISFATPSEQKEVGLEVPQDSSVRSILGFFADELSRLGFDLEASPVVSGGKFALPTPSPRKAIESKCIAPSKETLKKLAALEQKEERLRMAAR